MKRTSSVTAALLMAWAAGAAGTDSGRMWLAPGGAQVVIRASPREVKLADLGLREAGLAASPYFRKADEIRIFASADKTNESPQARIWVNAGQTNRYWFWTGGSGSAEDCVIRKGAAVAVLTRASTNPIAWMNPLTGENP